MAKLWKIFLLTKFQLIYVFYIFVCIVITGESTEEAPSSENIEKKPDQSETSTEQTPST